MQIRLLFFLLIAICAKIRAQQTSFGDYYHTINYADRKITFQIQEAGDEPKFTDPSKLYHWYSSNQVKVTQGGFSGKLLDGGYADYYLNKQLKEKGRFKLGLKKGEWNTWNEQGILLSKFQYQNGLLSGRYNKFDTLGNRSESGSYRNGKLHGMMTKTINRDSVQVSKYKNGKLVPVTSNSWLSRFMFWKKRKSVK